MVAQRQAVASEVDLTFKDGSKATARIGIDELCEMEERWPMGILPALTSTLYGAWHSLGRPGDGLDDTAKFKAWRKTVESIEDHEVEVDPSPPAVGADS